MSTTHETGEQPEFGWTRAVILVLGTTFAVFIVAVIVGMLTHRHDQPTIAHSWDDFYTWLNNSNFAGIGLGLLIPTIPLAVLAEVHHRRTTRRLHDHHELISEHHRLLTEIRDRIDGPASAIDPQTDGES